MLQILTGQLIEIYSGINLEVMGANVNMYVTCESTRCHTCRKHNNELLMESKYLRSSWLFPFLITFAFVSYV